MMGCVQKSSKSVSCLSEVRMYCTEVPSMVKSCTKEIICVFCFSNVVDLLKITWLWRRCWGIQWTTNFIHHGFEHLSGFCFQRLFLYRFYNRRICLHKLSLCCVFVLPCESMTTSSSLPSRWMYCKTALRHLWPDLLKTWYCSLKCNPSFRISCLVLSI